MSDLIKTELPLTNVERESLKVIVSAIIPPSEEFQLPGAADTEIFNLILAKAKPHEEPLKRGLHALNQQSEDRFQAAFADASKTDQSLLVDELKNTGGPFAQLLVTITMQAYYQDPRVLESVGMETRPPFPQGHELQQGDWSLLDPVRKREKFYRKV